MKPQGPYEIARSIREPKRRGEPLTAIESIAMECIRQIVCEVREITQEEITAAVGSENQCGSTATHIVSRLVDKGQVERIGLPLQKAIWLRIVATGQQSKQPKNLTVHHSYRTESIPTPTIQKFRECVQSLASIIEIEARRLRKPLPDFIADLAYIGWHEYRAEQERGE